jgi:hypothetical protein
VPTDSLPREFFSRTKLLPNSPCKDPGSERGATDHPRRNAFVCLPKKSRRGFLAKDLDELVRESVALARDDKLVSSMSDCAKQRSMAFTRDIFEQRIMSVVSQCLKT